MSSSDRKPYLTATVLDQDLLDDSHDNLVCELEMVCTIEVPSSAGFPNDLLYLSDRNKYVGEHFYDARLKFPNIRRTVGDLLSPAVEFASVKLNVNNADGAFNSILPGGIAFDSMISKRVTISLGLSNKAATYKVIFSGFISEIAGFGRTVDSFFIVARDQFDKLREKFPNTTFSDTSYPDIQSAVNGKIIPYIYGNWTNELNDASVASIPAFITNGNNASVIAGTASVSFIISENTNVAFDNTSVTLQRSDNFFTFTTADVTNIGVNNNSFDLKQGGNGGTTLIDGVAYTFASSDKFWVRVEGKLLGAANVYGSNTVAIARDILETFGGASPGGDFDANWDTLRDKNSPAESNIALFKCRAHFDKQVEALATSLSLLEQVRVEAYIDADQNIKLLPLHFDSFDAAPSFLVRNWDVERKSLQPQLDTRINVNRMKGFFNFLPDTNDNKNETNFFKNTASINQVGKTVNKGLVFPNLHERSAVDLQVPEYLKITSSFIEIISLTQTWRSLLLDVGDFTLLDISIGSIVYDSVPAMVRSISFSANGLRVIVTYWSFQMIPYDGYSPSYTGVVGGSTAIITEET